jgi:cobalt-zinc-cadmium efflux system outer membrane protein
VIQQVAHRALETAAEVSKAFAAAQAADQLVEFRRTLLTSAQGMAELSDRQYDAGNIGDLTHDSDRVQYEQAQLDLDQEELELAAAREHLNRLLGLWGPQTGWTIAQKLPEPPAEDPPLEHLEKLAIRQRLDVDMARKQVALMTRAVALAKDLRLFGRVEVGLDAHQDADGPRTVGVGLTLELPIFDHRQAQIAKLEAERRQTERHLEAIAIDVRSEVRGARTHLMTSRRVVERYRTRLLPMRERIVEMSQLHYNGMLMDSFQLVAAKQAQVETYRAYVAALLGYWNARYELERAVGGRIKPAAESRK